MTGEIELSRLVTKNIQTFLSSYINYIVSLHLSSIIKHACILLHHHKGEKWIPTTEGNVPSFMQSINTIHTLLSIVRWMTYSRPVWKWDWTSRSDPPSSWSPRSQAPPTPWLLTWATCQSLAPSTRRAGSSRRMGEPRWQPPSWCTSPPDSRQCRYPGE